MIEFPILTALLLLPLATAVAVMLTPAGRPGLSRGVALGGSLLSLVLVLLLWSQFDASAQGLQQVERTAWIPALNVEYFLGLDGLTLMLLLLGGLLVPLALAAPLPAKAEPRLFLALVLCLQAMVFGVFLSLNFVLWFLFWELSLIPAFLLIKIWGGSGRSRAAYQFFIYTLTGSVGMLLGFLALYLATGVFDFMALAELARSGALLEALNQSYGSMMGAENVRLLIFGGVLFGLAVKVPMIPFHSWLPDAYAEAPSSVTLLLTGLLSKMGLYGFLRILLPIFPEPLQALQPLLLGLALATILLSSLAALAQTDLKRMLAYSSINHLGYCLLGLFAVVAVTTVEGARDAAMSGVMLQIFNHGLTAGALFYFISLIESRSGGLHGLDDFGGLRRVAPVLCGLMGIGLFASLGLPGLNGFVSEFLIFRGVFSLHPWAAVLALPALLFTAIFLLRILSRVFFGPLNERWSGFADLSIRERICGGTAVALMFVVGIFPGVLLHLINPSVLDMLRFLP
jgi:NADH-quinone oxidoreductase subunit M